jgi:hypothetical protein
VTPAETGLPLADAYRDGDVPAQVGLDRLVDVALPAGEWGIRGADSAARQERRHDAPAGGAEIEALSAQAWTLMATAADGTLREWAEVPFVPSWVPEQSPAPRAGPCSALPHLAIRIRPAQGTLFFDGAAVHHEAVVTKDWPTEGGHPTGLAARQGGHHRAGQPHPAGRAGGRCLPLRQVRGRRGLAAPQVLTHNFLELLKAVALAPALRRARPKRFRFAVFTAFGRVVRHARDQFRRVAYRALRQILAPAFRRLVLAPRPPGP